MQSSSKNIAMIDATTNSLNLQSSNSFFEVCDVPISYANCDEIIFKFKLMIQTSRWNKDFLLWFQTWQTNALDILFDVSSMYSTSSNKSVMKRFWREKRHDSSFWGFECKASPTSRIKSLSRPMLSKNSVFIIFIKSFPDNLLKKGSAEILRSSKGSPRTALLLCW